MSKSIRIFSVFHLALIFLVSIDLSYEGYRKFYSKEPPPAYDYLQMITRNRWTGIYTKYTGAENGYGYFAPNVLSSGTFVFRSGKTIFDPALSNSENMIRYQNLSSAFISHAVSDHSKETEAEKKASDLKTRYFDLLFKNLSLRFARQRNFQDTLHAQLLLYYFPSLQDFGAGKKQVRFLTLTDKVFFIKNP